MGDQRAWKTGRFAIMVIGIAVMVVGLVIVVINRRVGDSSLILLIFGTVGVVVAGLGRRSLQLYRTGAVLLANTVVLIISIEGGVIVVGDVLAALQPRTAVEEPYFRSNARRAALPYYQDKEWVAQYWAEFDQKRTVYRPYTIWRHAPLDGETIKINEAGIRYTPGAECQEGARQVFMFGGSTLWGDGAPDWGTIPAYIQASLSAQMELPVCVTNFGESAYHSTQEVIDLVTQLQLGNRPDVVIFVDGVNEVGNVLELGETWLHSNYSAISGRFNREPTTSHPLVSWVRDSHLFKLLQSIRNSLRTSADVSTTEAATLSEAEIDALVEDTVRVYLQNYRIVEALSKQYGFAFYFFWQPVIGIENKPLTAEEQEMLSEMDAAKLDIFPDGLDFYRAVYQKVKTVEVQYPHLYYIADVLDGHAEQLYIDLFHLTPEGNALVAARILDVVAPPLVES